MRVTLRLSHLCWCKKSHLLPMSAQWWVYAPARTAREPMSFYALPLYSIMNVRGRESMVKNLETNFSKSLQMGFGNATRCVKGMQKVFGKRRGMGRKIINTITEIIPIKVDRYPFWCPCLFVLLHKGYHKSLGWEVCICIVLDNHPMPRHSASFSWSTLPMMCTAFAQKTIILNSTHNCSLQLAFSVRTVLYRFIVLVVLRGS